jgi:small subunit ribosomal protein S15
MSIEKVKEIQKSPNDCGSTGVQIYYLTQQINSINEHLKKNPKDHAAKRGAMVLIGKRNSLCVYFKRKYSLKKYEEVVIDKIGLRK